MQRIVPHLWFDKEAEEAANFYISLFDNSKLKDKVVLNNTPSGSVDLLTIELAGQDFMLISAGPYFRFTPAISFLVACNTVAEVEELWERLVDGGFVLMPLDEYPFSVKYGWLADKYGLSWQVMYVGDVEVKQKITPYLLFVGDQAGKAEEAIGLYTSIFKNARIGQIMRHGADATPEIPGTIQQVKFTLEHLDFIAMDSALDHNFTFNEAISFVVNCDTQEEIDYYWEKLSAVPEAEQCGWLKDSYGVSWQIVPSNMNDLMRDEYKLAKVSEAMLQMKKIDMAELANAYQE